MKSPASATPKTRLHTEKIVRAEMVDLNPL